MERGKKATPLTMFLIPPSRGSPVLQEVFGHHFAGTMCCDFWSAYRKYLKSGTKVQFCWAHLIRDIKFLTTLNDPLAVEYGNQLLQIVRQIFYEIHHRDESDEQRVCWKLRQRQLEMLDKATINVPDNNCSQNMANRFILFGDCYFRFIDDPTVPPTNNHTTNNHAPAANSPGCH